MALTASNVRVGVTGAVYHGTIAGVTLPVDATTALDSDLADVGYLSEDGITEALEDSRERIRAWQNSTTVREVRSDFAVRYSFTMIESNLESMRAYYGRDNVTSLASVEIAPDNSLNEVWVVQIVDGDQDIRIVIPNGQVTERGEVTYVGTDAIAYPVTVTAYPDSTGVNAYRYQA